MNRVIKFRGRVKNSNEWKYGSLLTYANGECNIITETGHRIDTWNVDPETVGQYTGFHDCKGNEIYVGDIIQYSDNHPKFPMWENQAVFFNNGAFRTKSRLLANIKRPRIVGVYRPNAIKIKL